MSMSKEKIAAIAGVSVFVIAAGALGYFLYDAYDQRTAQEEDLDSQLSAFEAYQNENPFPSKKSIAGAVSNKAHFAQWRKDALDLAAKGDWVPAEESPAQFKQRLQAEVRRLAELAGGVEGRIAAPTFLFGFEQYLGENGELPKLADVPRLVRELDFITRTVETFAEADGLEVKDVKRLGAPKAAEDDAAAAKKRKRAKGAAEEGPSRLDFAFEFAVRPATFVALLNALTAEERFCTITRLAFRESSDLIVEKLAAADPANQKKAEGGRRGRRGRRGAETPAENAAPAKVDRLVVDPELDAPIILSLTLSVYDFGRGAAKAAPAAADAPAPAKSAATDKPSKEAK